MSAVLLKNENKSEVLSYHQSNPYTIDDLPNDVLLKIFDLLSLQSLGSCAQVCKKWKVALGNIGDKLFLKFFKGNTYKEKLQHQVGVQKTLTEATETTHLLENQNQLLENKNKSNNTKRIALKVALAVAFVLLVAGAVALTIFTGGTVLAAVAVGCGGFALFCLFCIFLKKNC